MTLATFVLADFSRHLMYNRRHRLSRFSPDEDIRLMVHGRFAKVDDDQFRPGFHGIYGHVGGGIDHQR